MMAEQPAAAALWLLGVLLRRVTVRRQTPKTIGTGSGGASLITVMMVIVTLVVGDITASTQWRGTLPWAARTAINNNAHGRQLIDGKGISRQKAKPREGQKAVAGLYLSETVCRSSDEFRLTN